MDPPNGSGSGSIKKQEDLDGSEPKVAPKSETKPAVRTLNRVPRKWRPFLRHLPQILIRIPQVLASVAPILHLDMLD